MPAVLFHTLIIGYKPQQWPKQNKNKREIKNQKNHKQNDLTRNFRFSPPFWQQVPKTRREKKAQESISSRRRIGRRIGCVVGKEGPHHVFLE
jgi:hypothetical protein